MLRLLRKRKKPENWVLVTILFGLAILSAIASAGANGWKVDEQWAADIFQGFTTELLGAIATFVMIEWTLGDVKNERQEAEAQKQLKEKLIRQMGSAINAEAIRAVEELRAYGWMQDGSVKGSHFISARLKGVSILSADLQETVFYHADLEEARLISCNLSKAKLSNTNLTRAMLVKVDLRGANLRAANLEDAQLVDVQFDEETCLPNGQKWHPELEDEKIRTLLKAKEFVSHLAYEHRDKVSLMS